MKRERRKFSNEFKAEVVLEALKEKMTTAELVEKFKVAPNQISTWKAEFLSKASDVFNVSDTKAKLDEAQKEKSDDVLYSQIGRLKMEIDWLKKKLK
jgi:transposase